MSEHTRNFIPSAGPADWRGYSLAVMASAGAVALRALLDAELGASYPFIFSFGAVALAAAYGGWRPALLAMAINYAAVEWLFIDPRQHFTAISGGGLVAFGSFFLTAGIITGMAEMMRCARLRSTGDAFDLAAERERLRVTLLSIGDAVVTTNEFGAVNFLNPVAERLTGWTVAEAQGRALAEVMAIFHEETGVTVESPVERVLRERIVVAMANHTVLRPRGGGVEIPIEDSAAPILAPDGSLRGAIMVFHDVTARRIRDRERRAAEVQLRASETRSRAIIDTAIDGVLLMDAEGRIVDWNPAAERIFGWRRDEVLGEELADHIIPERLREGHRRGLAHFLATGEGPVLGRRLELPALRRDGVEFPVELSINPLPGAERSMFVGFIRDVSQRKASELEMAERARLAALRADIASLLASPAELDLSLQGSCELLVRHLDASFARIWLLDDTEQTLILRAGAGLYTHLNGDHARVPVGQFKIGRIAESRRAHLTNDVANDPNISDPQWAAREGMIAFAGYPLIVDDRLLGVVGLFAKHSLSEAVLGDLAPIADGIATSIERRSSEAALRAEKERAEAASRAKDNFLAALSHELRTPLMPVLMTAAALREDLRVPESIRAELGMIERNIALEARLIDDLLDLTRITKGRLQLREEMCDVHSLIGLAVAIMRDEAQAKPVAVNLELAAHRASLRGDPARLQQVFWNLLRNAIKFTPIGGQVKIRTRDETGGRLRIEVSDNGVGLPTEALESIFQPFEQAGRENDHRFGGLGLGLAIARAIVDLHGGKIRAESAGLDKGATFIVELPQAIEQPAGSDPIPSEPEGDLSNADKASPAQRALRLLLVEDHEPTLTVLSRLLRRDGHFVMGANSVAAALAAGEAAQFDFVVSDLGLPDGTGTDVMEALRLRQPEILGIALSGYGMEDDLRRSIHAGFSTHLIKPVDLNQLRRALRTYSRKADGKA